MSKCFLKRATLCSVCWSALIASPVGAQAPSSDSAARPQSATASVDMNTSPAPTEASSDDKIADIVVTAQRRAESVTKVPIAITVITGSQLSSTNAVQLSDIQQLAPSVQYTETASNPTYQIRGIGTTSLDYSIESAVGVAVDDVNVTLPRVNPLNILADVDRIEVLRGPQGTLFGKNTTAGLISVTTKRPQLGAYSNEGHVQLGSRNQAQVYDIVNLPVTSTMAARFRVGYQTQESPLKVVGGGYIPPTRNADFNGKVLWKPTDRLTLYAIGDYQHSSGDIGTETVRSYDPAPGATFAPGKTYGAPYGAPYAGGPNFIQQQLTALGITAKPGSRLSGIGSESDFRSKYYGGQLSADYELGGGQTLTSVTSYHKSRYQYRGEVDYTPLPVLDQNNGTVAAHQFTQELRIASPSTGRFNYVAGLYYYQQSIDASQIRAGTLGLLPNNSPILLQPDLAGGRVNFGVDTKSYAAFAQGSYRFTDTFRLTIGARGTRDEVRGSVFTSAVPGICGVAYGILSIPAFCQVGGSLAALKPGLTLPTQVDSQSVKHNDWSGRAGLEQDIGSNGLLYATISRGYKAAAVSTVSGQAFLIKPETVVAYEAGLKTSFFQRRLSIALSIFREDFSNFQTEIFDPNIGVGAFRTENAGKLRTQGVELETTVRPLRGLSVSGAIDYDDAKFRKFAASCYAGMTASAGCDYTTNPLNPTFNAAGDRLPNAPEWAGSVNASYETNLSEKAKVFGTVNWSYRSAVVYGVGDQGTRQAGYSLTNVNVGIGDADGRVRVSAFVRNLFDKRYAAVITPNYFDIGGYTQIVPDNAVRRIGVALDWHL